LKKRSNSEHRLRKERERREQSKLEAAKRRRKREGGREERNRLIMICSLIHFQKQRGKGGEKNVPSQHTRHGKLLEIKR
jgi:hypothetical protein